MGEERGGGRKRHGEVGEERLIQAPKGMMAPTVLTNTALFLAKVTNTVSNYTHEGTIYALIGNSGRPKKSCSCRGPIIGEVFES